MSQSNPDSPKKSRIRWLRMVIIAICLLPVAGLICLFIVLRIDHDSDVAILKARLQAEVQAREYAQSQMRQPVGAANYAGSMSAAPSIPKKQAQLVRIQLEFEDFETRTADAITVESDQSGSRLMIPSQVFTPMTGKINGRMVTRTASKITIVELGADAGPVTNSSGGMGMPPSFMPGSSPMVGYSGISILRDHVSLGLTELSLSNAILTPVRVLGDFPSVAVGDNLTVVSPSHGAPAPVLTVLGTDETTQIGKDTRLEHLLKLTEWTGPVGSMVCNAAGDPVGQIVFTTPGKLRYTYAVPMDRIFATIHDEAPRSEIRAAPDAFAAERRHDPLPLGEGPMAMDETPGRVDPAINPQGVESLAIDANPMNPKVHEAIGREPTSPDPQPGSAIVPGLQTPTQSLPVGNPILPADASQSGAPTTTGEMRVYRVQGFAPDVADTIRSLYGTEAKVAVDRGSRAVIAIAPPAVQERILATIEEMNLGAREVMAEQARKAELEKKQHEDLTVEQRLELDMQRKQAAALEAADDESHRKNPKRTRVVKVAGRQPQEVAKLLSTLFGQKADVAVDDRTGSVLITVNRATTWSEVQFLLSEIEATATRLAAETPVDHTTSAASTEQGRVNPTATFTKGGDSIRLPDQASADQDREARNLALQHRAVAASEQPALRAKLEQELERQFRQRQTLRKQEIDELSNRIEKLRTSQLRREENRSEIIRRRMNELLDPSNDLHWNEPESTAAVSSNPQDQSIPKAPPADSMTSSPERTFDGIPYSQWRKMLETERKPAKLVTAMEACSRLASNTDAHQIARAIIKATSFETDNSDERRDVWQAALFALERMPAEAVIDEALASLNSNDATSVGRSFQGVLFAHSDRTTMMRKALNARDQEIVASLVKSILQEKEDRDWLLAGACSVWEHSNHELKDFAGLEPLVMRSIDTQPPVSNFFFGDCWMIVAEALVKKNPETPGLAVKFMNYSLHKNAFADMTRLIGKLARHAEPAVPMIVERFLDEWKKLEVQMAADKGAGRQRSQFGNGIGSVPRRLIELLGEIGVGDKAASLLKELNLMATMTAGIDPMMRDVFSEARHAIGKFSAIPAEDSPPILRDESLIHGVWQVQSPNINPLARSEAWITRDSVSWVDRQNGQSIGDRFAEQYVGSRMKLDSTKTPKEIEFLAPLGSDPKLVRLGLYELTESTLKIYLAPLGKPRPSEIVKDAASISEGHLLIELRRSLPAKEER